MGLSTHVLDLVSGMPARAVKVTLYLDSKKLVDATTNEDGRCTDFLGAKPLSKGSYQFVFHIGEYLKREHPNAVEQPFFDQIPINFMVSDTERSYHVPLLISPYGYSTYRGS